MAKPHHPFVGNPPEWAEAAYARLELQIIEWSAGFERGSPEWEMLLGMDALGRRRRHYLLDTAALRPFDRSWPDVRRQQYRFFRADRRRRGVPDAGYSRDAFVPIALVHP